MHGLKVWLKQLKPNTFGRDGEGSIVQSSDHATDTPPQSVEAILQKYQEERRKRLRNDGNSQYVELKTIEKLARDPWSNDSSDELSNVPISTGSSIKYLIIGAGFGGLVTAVRLIQSGVSVEEILLVDTAGGFGGSWYWNRYPGLRCDVESYIYLPLIEELDYMPKDRYSTGEEIRTYATNIAQKFNFSKRALFHSDVKSLNWNEGKGEWDVEIHKGNGAQDVQTIHISAQFVFLLTGLLTKPKLPGFPGLKAFKGHSFHSSRWDYDYTGGSSADPSMNNLKDKRVGIIGTGASSIQVVPELAKWAREVVVFQRTPTAVNNKNNKPTDPKYFHEKIKTKNGWHKERIDNFDAHVHHATTPDMVNLVDDGWTRLPTYKNLVGNPNSLTPQDIPAYIGATYAADLPAQNALRAQVEEVVKDKAVAEKLKPWYPTWCKRPGFSDDYLQTFNLPNVTLVDTDGNGVEALKDHSVVAAGKEHEVDVLIFGTGFDSPAEGSPAFRAGLNIVGREGVTMDDKWANGVSTLHGYISNGLPNLFTPGPNQSGARVCHTATLDTFARHVSYIIAKARERGESKVVIEPTKEATEEWSMRILQMAATFAPVSGCLPSYLNAEGDHDKPKTLQEQMKAARASPWGYGSLDYERVITEWREEGNLKGLEITTLG